MGLGVLPTLAWSLVLSGAAADAGQRNDPDARGWVADNPNHSWQGLSGVWGSSSDDVWAVGERGTALRFNGSRWAPVDAGVAFDLNAVSGTRADDVWAVGQHGTALHWDGASWRATRANDDLALNRLFVPAPAQAWAVASRAGVLLRWQGEAWARVDPGIVPFNVWGTGPTDVWVLSASGELARFDGVRWRRGPGLFATGARALSGLSPRNVIAVGTEGKILRFDGRRWWKETMSPSQCSRCDVALDAVWAAGPREAWAFGVDAQSTERSAVLRWNGEEWNSVTAPDGMTRVQSVWGRSPSDGWAVDARGSIFHYDGKAWSNTTPSGPVVDRVYAVAAVGTELWVAGTGVMRLSRGAWEAVPSWPPSPRSDLFNSIAGVAPDDVTAVTVKEDVPGYDGHSTLWRYDGRTWTEDPSGPRGARVLWQKSAEELWAAGDRGAVWRRVRGRWTLIDAGGASDRSRAYAIVPDRTGGAWVTGDSILKRCQATRCVSYEIPFESSVLPLVGAWAISADRAYAVMGLPSSDWSHGGSEFAFPALAEWAGTEWQVIAASTLPWMLGVTATGPDDVWGLAEDGGLIHYDGKTWERSWLREAKDLTHIIATDGVVRVIGDHGRVFKRLP